MNFSFKSPTAREWLQQQSVPAVVVNSAHFSLISTIQISLHATNLQYNVCTLISLDYRFQTAAVWCWTTSLLKWVWLSSCSSRVSDWSLPSPVQASSHHLPDLLTSLFAEKLLGSTTVKPDSHSCRVHVYTSSSYIVKVPLTAMAFCDKVHTYRAIVAIWYVQYKWNPCVHSAHCVLDSHFLTTLYSHWAFTSSW